MISLILTLVIIGVLMWAINQYVPMQPTIKNLLNIVVVICVVIYLLNVFGILGGIHDVPVPRVR